MFCVVSQSRLESSVNKLKLTVAEEKKQPEHLRFFPECGDTAEDENTEHRFENAV